MTNEDMAAVCCQGSRQHGFSNSEAKASSLTPPSTSEPLPKLLPSHRGLLLTPALICRVEAAGGVGFHTSMPSPTAPAWECRPSSPRTTRRSLPPTASLTQLVTLRCSPLPSVVPAPADLGLTPCPGGLVDWLTVSHYEQCGDRGWTPSDAVWCGPCPAAGPPQTQGPGLWIIHSVPNKGGCGSASGALVQEDGVPQLGLSLRELSEPCGLGSSLPPGAPSPATATTMRDPSQRDQDGSGHTDQSPPLSFTLSLVVSTSVC